MYPKSKISPARGPLAAAFQQKSRDRKLAPVDLVDRGPGKRLEPVAVGPFVSTTYVSIASTCPRSCPFFDGGCYAASGTARRLVNSLDAAAFELTSREVIQQEVALIDSAFGGRDVPQDGGRDGRRGRDLRLHVAGDVRTTAEARLLAAAAERWHGRGGGVVWTYTHRWRVVPRAAWGSIRVLASVEDTADIAVAHARGYDVAIVVPRFTGSRRFIVGGSDTRLIPCPAQTNGSNCVECRLCFGELRSQNIAIAFAAHGPTAERARRMLPVVRA